MKYEKMNQEILEAIGGEENIQSVVHCSTRLRFVLRDESKADDKKAEAIDGVLQVVKKGGQYQLVIGNTVEDVYDDLIKMIHIDNNDSDNKPKKKQNLFDTIIGAITGSIAEAYYGVPDDLKQQALSKLPDDFILKLEEGYQKVRKL